MKTTAILLVAAVASAAGAAAAQSYPGYQGYQVPARAKAAPRFPDPPRPPEFAAPPAFKPFKGQHLYSDRGGLNPYPAPKKPRGGFSTYGH